MKAPVLLELRFYWEETNLKQVNYMVYYMATNVKKENKEGKGDGAAASNGVVGEGLTVRYHWNNILAFYSF